MSDSMDAAFDGLMEKVGYDGVFQKRFNYIFNIGLVMVASIIYNSMIFAFAKQDHWCHVPGREHTNLTVEQWRNMTVPSELDDSGHATFSKCQMFDVDWSTFDRTANDTASEEPKSISCRQGWDYDRQWYENTVVSQENWVCDKDMYQTNVFALGRMGEVLGSLIFGQLGDRIGRRKLFYLSILVLLVGKTALILSVSYYTLVSVFAVVGSLAANSVFQSPLIIAMETNRAEKRAGIALMQTVFWSTSMCLMPMIFWALRDWSIFSWATTLPLAIFLLFPSYMIESPRWLATSGRLAECAKYLTNIARINGRPTDEITETYLKKMLPASSQTEQQVYGMWTFFTGWRIARNTFLVIFCWCVCSLTYFTLLLSVSELPGNPFVNFLIQSLIEFPSYFLGQYLCNKIGRRFTNSLAMALAGTMMFAVVCIVKYESLATATVVLTFATKFCVTIAFYAMNLQAMETHPTCLRQTGLSMGILVANVAGMLGPYIVYLGKHYDVQWPYIIMCGMFFLGMCACLFTVETHLQKLPDSLEEAMHFGENQKFWSFPRAPKEAVEMTTVRKDKEEEAEKLNQPQYSP